MYFFLGKCKDNKKCPLHLFFIFYWLFFALPSLQSRDNTIGFRETGVKQTCLLAAFEAGYSGVDRANFMRG
jgi:hypothetical protein